MPIRSVTGQRIARLGDGWRLTMTEPGVAATPTALPAALDWVPAMVPGTAAQALQAAGRFSAAAPHPLHDKDIWYHLPLNERGPRTLRFEGLATCAEVWLNANRLLESANMFRTHEIDVELAGDDHLFIVFRSLDKAIESRVAEKRGGRARWRTRLVENNGLRLVRATLLGHMTGWQAAVHAVGPWRPISLIEQSPLARVRAHDLQATLEGDDGVLKLTLELDRQGLRPAAVLHAGSHSASLTWAGNNRVAGTLRIRKVDKWWPRTHGAPTLYPVRLRLGEIEVDFGMVGFRSIALDRDDRNFALKVNGQPVFARGACWSASDLVSLAGDRASVEPWLNLAADAHMNMIRVGGTMVYESEDFFTLCDELGLMVWHDFMFANMDYPVADEAFRTEVDLEARQFLHRTQGHPCLALACGGSEVAQQVAMLGLPPELWTGPLYEDLLPKAVAAVRPDVPYVAHSPGGGDLPFATDAGVSHYYGVGAYRRPLEDARRAGVRFTSECLGFANVPGPASPDVPWNDFPAWKAAVPRDRGTDWDFEDVRDHYLRLLYEVEPARLQQEDRAHYLRLSRAVSADVMQATIAEWRRGGSSCSGALVWMFKDFTPGAGWGVADAAGLPKLAWHGLRRAFRPVRAALTDEGLNGLGVHLINDGPAAVRARLGLVCLQGGATVTLKRERDVELPARSSRTVSSAELIGSFFDLTYAYRFGPPPLDVAVVRLSDPTSGAVLDESLHFPLGRAALTHDSGLTAQVVQDGGGWALRLEAARIAPSIQIEDAAWRAADEGFALMPGEQRTVKLIAASTSPGRPIGRVFSGLGKDLVSY